MPPRPSAPPSRRPRRAAGRAALPLAVAAAVALSSTVVAHAGTTSPDPTPLETANAALSRSAATQGMVLLENRNNALPMPASGNVAVFGVGAYETVKGGTGSGNVNNRYTIGVRQGLENAGYEVTTKPAYWNAMVKAYDTKYGDAGNSPFGATVDYASVEQPLTATSVLPTKTTDTAVYVLARNSGEGSDRTSAPGDYALAPVEAADLAAIGHAYKRVIVVLNTGGIVDTSFFRTINARTTDPGQGQALDAMLLMSQAGQESGNAVTDVLSGKVTPSGRLTDTWASRYSDYPAAATFGGNDGNTDTESYDEGIYVGYRYFDSFYEKIKPNNPASVVTYPFGYGLSYTGFAVTTLGVSANPSTVTVQARVTNTGRTYTGKDVVQVYFSAPTGKLDKPYQQLAGYAKTGDLAPGASQTVTVRFRTTDMASYDTGRAAYVMEAGNYVIRVGESSRATHIAAKLRLASTVTTEQVANEMDDARPTTQLTSSPANFYSYPAQAGELAAAPQYTLPVSGFVTRDDASEYEQDIPVNPASPYHAIDGNEISSTTAYVPNGQTDWERTGAPYQAKQGETVSKVRTVPGATLYDVAKGSLTMRQFVASLSVDQLANIVEGSGAGGSVPQAAGAAGYTTAKYENLGIPGMVLSDGPAGLRLTQQVAGDPTTYQYATAWPIGTLLAQTWDRGLVQRVGTAIGKEMRSFGVTMWLAPGMNIHRDPLNGRNFEYFSEDPLVSGDTASSETLGVQSNPGVGVTVKHFVANNQEANRNAVDETIGERALREIYLRGFQIAVESAQPMAVMSSYNQVNGTFTSADYDLLTDLLRGEWGFKGLVMSDWGGSHNPVATMYAGNDLIEPGGNPTEISINTSRTTPTLDVTGLPVLAETSIPAFQYHTYNLATGGLSLSPTGAEKIITKVDSGTDLSDVLSTITTLDAQFHPTTVHRGPYATVADAYADLVSILASDALSDTQRSAVRVKPTYQVPGDASSTVVAYTVTVRGDYATLRLGDLQRSVTRILTVATKSAPFAALAKLQGVTGIRVGPYSG
ncbi:glycoside hydrolase family 3 protein [Jatrophihabitans sp. YIM 134969]